MSILTSSLTVWYGSCTEDSREKLQDPYFHPYKICNMFKSRRHFMAHATPIQPHVTPIAEPMDISQTKLTPEERNTDIKKDYVSIARSCVLSSEGSPSLYGLGCGVGSDMVYDIVKHFVDVKAAIAWFKQTPGEKPLLIASAFHSLQVKYHNDFGNSGRFNAVILSLGSSSDLYAVLQHPVSDPVELGGNTTLQCSVLTDTSAGEHSVYWIRHGSGESHPGIIYTHGNRSDQCESSSETDSSTQSCVYNLPKRNLSLSDAGTYYCAVLMCEEIIFGSGTKLDFVGKIICLVQAEAADALNYAALSFAQSSSSRKSRTKNSSDQPVYSQVNIRQ
ncbi:hypothetical protein NFI96_032422 [Prochilodus magdalenae]|nr:hypothetical protein NFI96_032422 [Prochilodus magdalenae]